MELEKPGALERAQQEEFSLGGLIRWYIDSFFEISSWQRTKQTSLEFLDNHQLGEVNVLRLTTAILIDHVRARRADGAGPATVGNDLTWIGVELRAAKSTKELPIHTHIVDEARTDCRELRLIGKSRKRDRRPTPDELARLRDFFGHRDCRAEIRHGFRLTLHDSWNELKRYTNLRPENVRDIVIAPIKASFARSQDRSPTSGKPTGRLLALSVY